VFVISAVVASASIQSKREFNMHNTIKFTASTVLLLQLTNNGLQHNACGLCGNEFQCTVSVRGTNADMYLDVIMT
jgi:transcription elongation factor Elf1